MANKQLEKIRPADDQFPMLMTKQTLGDFLGKSQDYVDALLRSTRLAEACWEMPGKDPVYLKPLVIEIIPTLKD